MIWSKLDNFGKAIVVVLASALIVAFMMLSTSCATGKRSTGCHATRGMSGY